MLYIPAAPFANLSLIIFALKIVKSSIKKYVCWPPNKKCSLCKVLLCYLQKLRYLDERKNYRNCTYVTTDLRYVSNTVSPQKLE